MMTMTIMMIMMMIMILIIIMIVIMMIISNIGMSSKHSICLHCMQLFTIKHEPVQVEDQNNSSNCIVILLFFTSLPSRVRSN